MRTLKTELDQVQLIRVGSSIQLKWVNYYLYRDLPRAVFATFAIITAVCVLANIAYSVLLTPQEILQSDAVAVVSFQAFT